jgi:hypothetical protein
MFFYTSKVWATEQVPDILWYEGNKYVLYSGLAISSPLEIFPEITEKLAKTSKRTSSNCWRQYSAEWVIEDGELYLSNVKRCDNGTIINSLVEKVTKRKFVNGKLKADWVDGAYWGGNGDTYWNSFENEALFFFENGEVTDIKEIKSSDCSFQEKDNLDKFIYSNVNWKDLPENRVTVTIEFEIDRQGKIIQSQIKDTKNSEFEKEALRVLKSVPCWKVYTHRGKVFGWKDIEIEFSERNRIKYAR